MNVHHKLALGIFCFVLLLALPGAAMSQSIPFKTIDKGEVSYYRYSDPDFAGAVMDIKDWGTWAWFWRMHKRGIRPMPTVPFVDFKTEMVLVAILGYQTSGGGSGIEIASIEDLFYSTTRQGRTFRVLVEENRNPGPLDVITNPYHIIRVMKASSVIFEREATQEAETYHLSPESTYYEGCVSPCMCPVMIGGEIQGSFDLVETGADQWFKYYEVDRISWIVVDSSGQALHKISGKGSYKIGGDFALTHEMILTLGIDGQRPAVFSSGLVPGGENFPAIVIPIDRGTECYSIWMDLLAKPIR